MVSDSEIDQRIIGRALDAIERNRAKRAGLVEVLDRNASIIEVLEDLDYDDESLTAEDREAAFRIAFDELLGFPDYDQGWSYQLAKAWVYRKEIGLRVGVPVLAGGLLIGSVLGVNEMVQLGRERGVENRVETLYQTRADLLDRLNAVVETSTYTEIPDSEQNDIQNISLLVAGQLALTNDFFRRFCPEGQAETAVTPENFSSIEDELNATELIINGVQEQVDRAGNYIVRQRELDALQEQVEGYHHRIQEVAQDPAAILLGNTLYEQAQSALQRRDLELVRQLSNQQINLNTRLNDQYTVYILFGIERDGGRFYLVTEARTLDGTVLELAISDEEQNGREFVVSQWGERVPQQVYENLRADYEADNILNDNILGQKSRGYLNPVMNERFQLQGGQIIDVADDY